MKKTVLIAVRKATNTAQAQHTADLISDVLNRNDRVHLCFTTEKITATYLNKLFSDSKFSNNYARINVDTIGLSEQNKRKIHYIYNNPGANISDKDLVELIS